MYAIRSYYEGTRRRAPGRHRVTPGTSNKQRFSIGYGQIFKVVFYRKDFTVVTIVTIVVIIAIIIFAAIACETDEYKNY